MQIGELARATGVSVRALRHYEKQGLLASRRAENGYRVFRADSADRVGYIRLFLSCGFATREIAQFLPCYVDQANFDKESCPLGYEQHLEKLVEIEELIAVLNDRRDRLHHAIANFGATTVERLSVNTTARQVA